jgi:hypothetical protein
MKPLLAFIVCFGVVAAAQQTVAAPNPAATKAPNCVERYQGCKFRTMRGKSKMNCEVMFDTCKKTGTWPKKRT